MSTYCMLFALYNAGVYALEFSGKVLPFAYWDLYRMLDEYLPECETGPMIHKQECIDKYKLPLVKAADAEEVVKYGGVLSILHPIWNGHAMFVQPADEKGYLWAINSFLGAERMMVNVSELRRFFPPHNNLHNYRLKLD